MTFLEALEEQRWDDHRYYHHSRVNQSLHLVSALSFLVAYAMLFVEPAVSALIGWLIAMPSRQIGHFFFEPKGYDAANQATHEHKEAIKVGYNLRRKIVLLSIWFLSPLALIPVYGDLYSFVRGVALLWLWIGIGAVFFRTIQLFFLKDVQAGLVWFTKILTDPFHDVKIYHRAPLYLLRGELYDPIVGSETEPVRESSLATPVS